MMIILIDIYSIIIIIVINVLTVYSISIGTVSVTDSIELQNILFPSNPEVISGEIILNGTLFIPKSISTSSTIGIVLVTGSGPSSRYESVGTNIHPLLDIALSLASMGNIVLTYDKRSCLGHQYTCNYNPCNIINNITTNCINVELLQYSDFISDAISAVYYLLSIQPQLTELILIGHSEGCSNY